MEEHGENLDKKSLAKFPTVYTPSSLFCPIIFSHVFPFFIKPSINTLRYNHLFISL